MADTLTLAADRPGFPGPIKFKHPLTDELLTGSPVPGVDNRDQVTLSLDTRLTSPFTFTCILAGQVFTFVRDILYPAPVEPAPAPAFGTFAYTVPEGHTTSAAWVETSSGDYVAPLWNNRAETPGTKTDLWEGRTYNLGKPANGEYKIKYATHAIKSEDAGGIGNTSLDLSDLDHMHRGYSFIPGGVEVGDYVYATKGNVERKPSVLVKFRKDTPQKSYEVLGEEHHSGCTGRLITYDGARIYTSLYDTIGTKQSFVIAIEPGKNDQYYVFTQGGTFKTQFGQQVNSTLGLQGEASANLDNVHSGLAVQTSGNLLALSFRAQNKVEVYNKLTGQLLKATTLPTPGGCCFDAQGRLWLASGTTVSCYAVAADGNLGSALFPVSGTVAPFNLSSIGNLVYVTDHGTSQQVKAYNLDGTQAWVLGQPNGQNATPKMAPDRFCFATVNKGTNWSSVIPLANGQFWVTEPGSSRMQLFNANRTPVGGKLGVISYRSNSYTFAINQNDPTVMYFQYQRIKVDYDAPMGQNWEVTDNYLPFAPASNFGPAGDHGDQQNIELGSVFKDVYTDPLNKREYAICVRPDNKYQEVELTATGLRLIGSATDEPYAFDKNGGRAVSKFGPNGTYPWLTRARTGFDANGDRILGAETSPAVVPVITDQHPVDYSGQANSNAAARTDSGYRVIYQAGLMRVLGDKTYGYGPHIGMVKEGVPGWAKLLNFDTGGAEYAGGQPEDGYYDTGDRAEYVAGKQRGSGGGAIDVFGEFILENVPGEGYRGEHQHRRFLWHSSGPMLHAHGSDFEYWNAQKAATGKKRVLGESGNVRFTKNVVAPGGDKVYSWNTAESSLGIIDLVTYSGLNTLKISTAATLTVAADSTFPTRYPAGTVNLLAKAPKRGTIFTTSNTGWTQSRADDSSNKFGGGPYWKAEFGVKTYNIFKPNGIYFRFRAPNGSAETSILWRSEAFAMTSTGNNWELVTRENYEDHYANNGERGQANSGGLYRSVWDLAGKELVRSCLKDMGNGVVTIFANGQVLVTGPAGPLTALWQSFRFYQDVRTKNTDGVVTMQYDKYPAITLNAPFEAGADFNSPATFGYLAWNFGASLDRVTALESAYFIPGVNKPAPPTDVYALSATRSYPAANSYTYETAIIKGSSYAAVCVVRAETGYVDDPTLPPIIIEGRNFRNDTGSCVHVYMPNGREVTLRFCHLASKSNADFINVTNDSRITVYNCTATADGTQPIGTARGRFFYAFRPRKANVYNNYCLNTAGGKVEYWSGAATDADTLKWLNNRFDNICGGTGGDYRQGLQVQHVTQRPGMEIAFNQIINQPGASRVEDNINLGESNGTTASPPRVHDNYIWGAYPANPTDGGFTGTGITTDAGSQGVTVANGPNGWLVEDNWFVGCMNSCMNIAAGRENKYRRNKLVVSGLLADGRRLNGVNNAVSIFRGQPYSTEQFDANEITDNDIFVNRANGENYYYENSLDPNAGNRYVGPNSKALLAGNTLNTYRDGALYADEVATLKAWQAHLSTSKQQVGVSTLAS